MGEVGRVRRSVPNSGPLIHLPMAAAAGTSGGVGEAGTGPFGAFSPRRARIRHRRPAAGRGLPRNPRSKITQHPGPPEIGVPSGKRPRILIPARGTTPGGVTGRLAGRPVRDFSGPPILALFRGALTPERVDLRSRDRSHSNFQPISPTENASRFNARNRPTRCGQPFPSYGPSKIPQHPGTPEIGAPSGKRLRIPIPTRGTLPGGVTG